MKGLKLLDWTEEYFHSHGWCSGTDTGIQNQEFINERCEGYEEIKKYKVDKNPS